MRFAFVHHFVAILDPKYDHKATNIGPKTTPEITPKIDSENDAKMLPKRLRKEALE